MQRYTRLPLRKDGDAAKMWMLAYEQHHHVMVQNVHLLTDIFRYKFNIQIVIYQWTRHKNVGFMNWSLWKWNDQYKLLKDKSLKSIYKAVKIFHDAPDVFSGLRLPPLCSHSTLINLYLSLTMCVTVIVS